MEKLGTRGDGDPEIRSQRGPARDFLSKNARRSGTKSTLFLLKPHLVPKSKPDSYAPRFQEGAAAASRYKHQEQESRLKDFLLQPHHTRLIVLFRKLGSLAPEANVLLTKLHTDIFANESLF